MIALIPYSIPSRPLSGSLLKEPQPYTLLLKLIKARPGLRDWLRRRPVIHVEATHELLRYVEIMGLGFKGLGFKGLGFKGLGFRGLGFKGLGFKGLGFRGLGFKGLGFRGLGFRV